MYDTSSANREVVKTASEFLLTSKNSHLYCDNQGAIATASQPIHAVSSRSKHIDVRFHVIHNAAANGLIRLEYVRTGDITADILTKALPRETFQRHVRGLGMVGVKGDT
jgi:hypothetical protein